MLASCSKKSYTALIEKDAYATSHTTKYHLPKNVLKFEIIYTLNEPRVKKGSFDEALLTSSTKVTIEDPIVITKILVADPSNTFEIKGKQLSDRFFVNRGEDVSNPILEDTLNVSFGTLEASKKSSYSSFTDSSIEAEAFRSIEEIKNNLDKIKTKKEADMALKLITLFKSQFKTLNEDFQPYIKKHKVKYTIVIDPSELYSKDGNWSNIEGNTFYHTIFPEHIFKGKGILSDLITVKVTRPNVHLLQEVLSSEPIEGIVYRTSSASNIEILLNDYSLFNDAMTLAQLGQFKTIAVKDLEKHKSLSQPVVLFKAENPENQTETPSIFKEEVEQLDFDSSDTIQDSQEAILEERKEKLKNIDLIIKSLEKRITEF